MSGTDLRNQNRGLQNTSQIAKAGSHAKAGAGVKTPAAKTNQSTNLVFIGAMVFIMLTLIGLQSLGLLWLSWEQDHSQRMEAQMARIQTQISDLHRVVGANTTEDLIYLKILVLNKKVPHETARKIASSIYKFATRYKRDPDLILSIMSIESAFDPTIISSMGAIGLMQIMPQWIDVLDIRCDLNSPDCNIRYGLQILGAYEQLYGDRRLALTAYNRGPGPVDYALMRGKDPDNGYAGKVQAVHDRLRAIRRTRQDVEVASSKP